MENTILSEKYSDFVNTKSEKIAALIDTNAPDVPKLFRGYLYPVSSWPVIINKEQSTTLNKLSKRILKLIMQIPSLYFNNDEQKIAAHYFEGDTMLAQLAMMSHNKNNLSSSRLDLTYTKDGFKILEVNIGSKIGGWQVQSFIEIINDKHPLLKENYKTINTQIKYYEFIVENTLKQARDIDKELNIFISMEEIDDEIQKENIINFLNKQLTITLQRKGLQGKIYVGNLTELNLVNNSLYLGDKRIHTVLNKSGEETTPDIFRAFLMNAIYFPDHLGIIMYKDKGNLELLRELAENKKFSSEDNEMILKAIPWTKKIKEKEVVFNSETQNLVTLLRNHKDNFVIKAAYGYQGKDVFIGKFCTDKQWEEAIQLSLREEKFIAQEFSDSINFMAPDVDNVWAEHKLIWGSFGFGELYGGVWVRMSALKTDVGVINSATGAVEAIVYETNSENN